jgi:hypothetical protein
MSNKEYRCNRCDTPIQGKSELCVYCYHELLGACPKCMTQWSDGSWHVRRRGRSGDHMDCSHCGNERWILRKYRHREGRGSSARTPDSPRRKATPEQ